MGRYYPNIFLYTILADRNVRVAKSSRQFGDDDSHDGRFVSVLRSYVRDVAVCGRRVAVELHNVLFYTLTLCLGSQNAITETDILVEISEQPFGNCRRILYTLFDTLISEIL